MPKKNPVFDPESDGYDYDTATAAGMKPDKVTQHWGSVAPVNPDTRKQYGLPEEAQVVLKGRNHHSWRKTVYGEAELGNIILQVGGRYYSVPADWHP